MNLLKKNSTLPLSFGGGSISGEGGGYGFGSISEGAALQLLHYAFENGIRVFDTAPIYGYGLSEVRMGKAFHSLRDQVFLISKSGVDWHANRRVNMTNDPKVTERMLQESLRRLNTDYIDLYMIHWPDPKVDIREPLSVLQKAKERGLIKHLGLCNTHLEDLEKAKEVCHIEVVQSEFNFFNTKAEELFLYLEQHKISFMSWGTFDKGILTARVDEKRKFDDCDARSHAPWWKKIDKTEKYQKVRELKKRLDLEGKSLSRFAMEQNLSYPQVDNLIIGFRTHEQIDDVLLNLLKRLT